MLSKSFNQYCISISSINNSSRKEYITNPCNKHIVASLLGNTSMYHYILATGSNPGSYGWQQHTHTVA
jgi:hypothetical protein